MFSLSVEYYGPYVTIGDNPPPSQSTQSSGTIPAGKEFTGQRLDSGTGLYCYGARYYDPEIGRFISPDTIVPDFANPQSLNRYTYVLNNPLKYIDPTGMQEGEVRFPEEEEYLAGDLSHAAYMEAYEDWKEAYYAGVQSGAKASTTTVSFSDSDFEAVDPDGKSVFSKDFNMNDLDRISWRIVIPP
jgi:RHS repeat-associated protein